MIDLLLAQDDAEALTVLARHANGGSRYAAWKEQPRALYIDHEETLLQKVNYIHANPMERKLVSEPGDWPYSSFNWYDKELAGILPVVAPSA